MKRLWEKDRSVAVVQATGTGKSYIIAKLMSDFHEGPKLVMAPSRYILQQQESKIPWALNSTIFMTYTKGAHLTSEEISKFKCKLIVLDEFHRCGAEIWGEGVKRIINFFPDAYILGTSATPIRYLDSSRDMSDELFDSNVAVNLTLAEAIVRKILPSPIYISAIYSLEEEVDNLIEKLNNSKKNASEKAKLVSDINRAQFDWENTNGIPEILKKHLDCNVNKVIVFCKNEEHLDEMEVEVPRWFQKAKFGKKRKIYRVLSSDSESDRNIEEFRSANRTDTIYIIFAIDMLNEGLHIPDVGAVILLRPTESPTVFYQQIGRCIQVGSSNPPIIFDFVNNFNNIRATNFLGDIDYCREVENRRRSNLGLPNLSLHINIVDETNDILAVFEAIDRQIQPFEVGLEYLKKYVDEYGHSKIPGKFITSSGFRLGAWTHSRRYEYDKWIPSFERIKKLEELPGWSWNVVEAFFEEGLKQLNKFVENFKHSKVPDKYITPTGFQLGVWVRTRRIEYRNGFLSNERIRALESVPRWDWQPNKSTFNEGLEHLKQYAKTNGNALVPRSYVTSSGFKLGPWVNSRRVEYSKGILSIERTEKLEAIEGWVWHQSIDYFQECLQQLKNYVLETGSANVPKRYVTSSGIKLGGWLHNRYCDFKKGILSPEKADDLIKVTKWSIEPDVENFQEGLKHLKNYISENSHTKIPKKYKTSSGFKLGAWIFRKRNEFRLGILPSDMVSALEAVSDLALNSLQSPYSVAIGHLHKYVEENGNARVPHVYKTSDGFCLGFWVSIKRAEYKSGVLSPEKISELEKINGWVWSPYKDKFEKNLEVLKEFLREYGHIRVPRSFKTPSGETLGSWIHAQKKNYIKCIISEKKRHALEAIHGWKEYVDSN